MDDRLFYVALLNAIQAYFSVVELVTTRLWATWENYYTVVLRIKIQLARSRLLDCA